MSKVETKKSFAEEFAESIRGLIRAEIHRSTIHRFDEVEMDRDKELEFKELKKLLTKNFGDGHVHDLLCKMLNKRTVDDALTHERCENGLQMCAAYCPFFNTNKKGEESDV